MAPYQATAELDDKLIISIRCGGGGKHRKHAGQWVPLKNPALTVTFFEDLNYFAQSISMGAYSKHYTYLD